MATMDPLQLKFIAFAVFGKGQAVADQAAAKPKSVLMDSKGFAKLAKESKIMSGRLDLTRVDLCFTKCSDRVRDSTCFAALSLGALLLCCAHRLVIVLILNFAQAPSGTRSLLAGVQHDVGVPCTPALKRKHGCILV